VRKWTLLFEEGTTMRLRRSDKFLGILHAVSTLRQVIVTCFSTSRDFWPVSLRNDQETKDVMQVCLKCLAATFFEEGIQQLNR
jgi:hypothetical protein